MANSTPTQEQLKAAENRVDVTAHLASAMAKAAVTGERGIVIRSIPFIGQIGIRTVQKTAGAKALESALGVTLPASVGNVSSANGLYILWQSPDEFLLVTDPDAGVVVDAATQAEALATALGDEPGSVIDLSANRVLVEIAGPSAQEVLEKGCALDLHPRVFHPGTAVQSMLGKVPVFVWKSSEERFFLLARSSFADYLINWLIDAMQEYAVPQVN